jgi:glycosyltransferase involved in cell wall biosynthesis
MADTGPAVLVWSSLFPSPAQPQAGIFVQERMFRVAKHLPVTVISPQPWFPLQGLIRRFRPHFRPVTPRHEIRSGIEIHRPRYLSVPGLLKRLDGYLMALGARGTVRRLARAGRAQILDAHFGYPDGFAATRVGRWLGIPVTVTLRGTEVRHAADPQLRTLLARALNDASRLFAVSSSLRAVAGGLGIDPSRIRVVGNGVDAGKFVRADRSQARRALGLAADARVLVTVGGLVERKGFHRVIECLPALLERHPGLQYLCVGSSGPEGDYSREIAAAVQAAGAGDRVHMLGAVPHGELARVLSAADVFVLSTRNEGWANVLLEAMACGLPVVATDVGGNAEVVAHPGLGSIVPFGDPKALGTALDAALSTDWDRDAIRRHAEANDWQQRVDVLVAEFRSLAGTASARAAATTRTA